MSKARTLAGTVSTGAVLADGTVNASEIGSLTLPSGGDIVGTTAVQTLTNKTIDIASNTLTGVQASLVSGTNIKTIGGQSVLGSGDLAVASGFTLLSTVTASNSATVNFENISSTYDTYLVVGNNIRSAFSTTTNLRARPKLDGSFTPSASARYVYVGLGVTNGASGNPIGINGATEGSTTFVQMTDISAVAGSDSTLGTSFTLMLYGPMDSESFAKQGTFQSVSRASTSSGSFMNGSMSFGTSNFNCGPMTGIQFYLASGNIVTGTFRIYGLSKT